MSQYAYALIHRLNLCDVTVKTSAGDVTMANEGAVIVKKGTGAATAVTLPPNPGIISGQYPMVLVVDGKGDAASNNITISGAAAVTINGASTYVISENYGGALFIWNGTEWNLVAAFKANSTVAAQTFTTITATTVNATTTNETTANIGTANISTALKLTDVGSINAAGSVIGNATAIANTISVVAGADDAKGVVLPTAVAGKVLAVYSSQATNGLKVYPPVNGTINDGSANAAVVIEGKSLALFIGTSTTNWASIFTVNT